MLSLSDNEFSVLNFLVRNFTERLTIRNIAQKLNFSPAGVFNILKKLEKQGIVVGEKLGTGLFYSINFENKIAEHLAAIVLLYSEEKIVFDIEKIKQAKAAIFDKKALLLVTDSITVLDISIPNIDVIVKTEDEVIASLRKKEPETLQLLRKGSVLFGEDKVVEIIKNCISRF
ncbi:MarR family transcriptional regulator [Candidatus Woesearchaeota archaeon]|nr:MarR family transcriptional regulator [Candidatus Woesearchaeota archaeon]